MNTAYDSLANALYIDLKPFTPGRTFQLSSNVLMDVSYEGEVVGIEVLNPSPELLSAIGHNDV